MLYLCSIVWLDCQSLLVDYSDQGGYDFAEYEPGPEGQTEEF